MSDFARYILPHESSPGAKRDAARSDFLSHKLRGVLYISVILFAVAIVIVRAAQGDTGAPAKTADKAVQTPTPGAPSVIAAPATPSPTEDPEFLVARKRNEKAQAEYYEQLAAKIARQSEGGWANYLGLAVALISLSGALIAARVAYLSFFYNYQNQLRTNSDTRFFEALKRFGDKDSAAARTSAANMLAVMGKMELPKTDKRRPAFFGRRQNADAFEQPYYNAALDQLIAGHMLEDNTVVLESIKAAILELYPLRRETAIKKLTTANLKAQEDLSIALARFFSSRGAPSADAIDEDLWSRAGALIGFKSAFLKELVTRFDRNPLTPSGSSRVRALSQRFTRIFEEARIRRSEMQADNVEPLQDSVVTSLRAAAERLRTNNELLKCILHDGASQPVLPPQVLILEGTQDIGAAPEIAEE
jgi:hypothetical protein